MIETIITISEKLKKEHFEIRNIRDNKILILKDYQLPNGTIQTYSRYIKTVSQYSYVSKGEFTYSDNFKNPDSIISFVLNDFDDEISKARKFLYRRNSGRIA